MAVLLLAEVNNGELSMDATAKAVAAAKDLGDVTVLCAGASAADAAKEAATIDGCTPLGVLVRVLLPVALPGIISTAVYTFLLAWNEFLFALALTRSMDMRTVPVGISMMVGEFGLKWDEMMAFSVIGSLPVLILFMLVQRFVVGGLSAGGVKG